MSTEPSFSKSPALARLDSITAVTRGVRRRNIDHYDTVYRRIRGEEIARKLQNVRAYLERVRRTDTSWRGMFWGDLERRLQGKRVFEIGCGDGTNALVMAMLGASEVVAHDISSESARILSEAATALRLRNIRPLIGEFADLELPRASFDLVVGKALLHHLTHDHETLYLARLADLLAVNGEARFVEPAVNSRWLDQLRWAIPVPGRPSSLAPAAFRAWKERDPHPERDNSSEWFRQSGLRFFDDVEIMPLGVLERFSRWLPDGPMERSYRAWAHATEARLPMALRDRAARSQLIVYRRPRRRIVPLAIVRTEERTA